MGLVAIKWNTPSITRRDVATTTKNEAVLYMQKLVPWLMC
jgi:hypothetical protein